MIDLLEVFKGINDLYTKKGKLAAIWVNSPIITGEGKTSRLAAGAPLCIINGKITDCSEDNKPTHSILECYGTLVNQFELVCEDLETKETIIIKI